MIEDPNLCICATCRHKEGEENWTEEDCWQYMNTEYSSYEEADPYGN